MRRLLVVLLGIVAIMLGAPGTAWAGPLPATVTLSDDWTYEDYATLQGTILLPPLQREVETPPAEPGNGAGPSTCRITAKGNGASSYYNDVLTGVTFTYSGAVSCNYEMYNIAVTSQLSKNGVEVSVGSPSHCTYNSETCTRGISMGRYSCNAGTSCAGTYAGAVFVDITTYEGMTFETAVKGCSLGNGGRRMYCGPIRMGSSYVAPSR